MLRNREFRQFAMLFFFIAATAVTLGFVIDITAGILLLIAAAAFGIAFFAFTNARYKKIAQISHQIDLVLHNADHLYIVDSDEGELSILHSEITKMTQRIREQNDALKKEKEHLADSLADIAHQLRTPLTSANLILSLLANMPEATQQKAFVREAEELFVQMDWLLTTLLKLSRLDAGIVVFQRTSVEVSALIEASLRPFLISMELHHIQLQLDVPKGIIIQGDASWLSEAMQNIFKNCMESVGENGELEIVCRSTPLFTELTIHDNGPGFEKEDLARLFERFSRGQKTSTVGYGIGLALCKMIITRQNGTITAKNHSQGGAIFTIRFSK
ncbi:HAMP domain-containing histidine kinase [Aminipila butyrica]|uniref:histidine kinase n=1 Tax=Aminipila butyrica TaxID=433296 RepID=A0A858BT35_9FIRM|nr:HAMP domain-containing sensor histidine kinase [Aminipila butyrica]QIB68727.1 HAMP domain-containing histidine kinase [Aminipila butyrica]